MLISTQIRYFYMDIELWLTKEINSNHIISNYKDIIVKTNNNKKSTRWKY